MHLIILTLLNVVPHANALAKVPVVASPGLSEKIGQAIEEKEFGPAYRISMMKCLRDIPGPDQATLTVGQALSWFDDIKKWHAYGADTTGTRKEWAEAVSLLKKFPAHLLFKNIAEVDGNLRLSLIEKYLEKAQCGLSFKEFLSLQIYSWDGYLAINGAENSAYSNLQDIRKNLQGALDKIQPYRGIVYMGTYLEKDQLRDVIMHGFLSYKDNYLSASSGSTYARFMKNALLIITSKSGRPVDAVANLSAEKEVIFKPGLYLKINKVTIDDAVLTELPENEDRHFDENGNVIESKPRYHRVYIIEAEEVGPR